MIYTHLTVTLPAARRRNYDIWSDTINDTKTNDLNYNRLPRGM